MKVLCLFISLFYAFLLSGCASKSGGTVANSESFLILEATASDSYESLAQEHLGDKKYASIIKRYNPEQVVDAGALIAIPKQPLNRSGVFSNGYQQVPVLCYHQFTFESKGKSRMVVTEADFETQMKYLYDNGYNVIPLEDLAPFLAGQKELPDKSIVITIDDGYKSYMDVALPILKKYNFHSTMFVYPEFIGAGPALKWRDVKRLSNDPLVSIQSHSRTHDSLSRRPAGESDPDYITRLKTEVEDAEKILSKRTGNAINHFAYPYGNSSMELVNLLEENDYSIAVTVNNDSNPAFSPPFLIHRTMIYGGDSLSAFQKGLRTFNKADLR